MAATDASQDQLILDGLLRRLDEASKTLQLLPPLGRLMKFGNSLQVPEKALEELQLSCLPSLSRHICLLGVILGPVKALESNSLSEWQPAIKSVQVVCDHLLKAHALLASVLPGSTPAQNDGPGTLVVSGDRLTRTFWLLAALLSESTLLIRAYQTYLGSVSLQATQKLSLSKQSWGEVMQLTGMSLQTLESSSGLLAKSDADFFKEECQGLVDLIEDAILELQSCDHEAPELGDFDEIPQAQHGLLSSDGQRLGELDFNEDQVFNDHGENRALNPSEQNRNQLCIPILKLCRLLLNKLSRPNRSQLPATSQLNAVKLTTLLRELKHLSSLIDDIVAELTNRPHERSALRATVQVLKKSFDRIYQCGRVTTPMATPSERQGAEDLPLGRPANIELQEIDSIQPDEDVWMQVWLSQINLAIEALSATL